MIRLFLVMVFSIAIMPLYAGANDIQRLVKELNISENEKTVILSHIDDAKEKQLDINAIYLVLNEQKVKGAGYYDILKTLIRKEEVLYSLKNIGFPYQNDSGISRLLNYAMDYYSASSLKNLSLKSRQKSLKREDVNSLLHFIVTLIPYNVNETMVMNICYMLFDKGFSKSASYDAMTRLVMRHKDIRRSPSEILEIIEKELLKGSDIRKAVKRAEEGY